MNATTEIRRFRSLGGLVTIQAEGEGAFEAVAEAEQIVLDLHRRLTRFEETSELSTLNADPRERVPASEVMLRFAETVGFAGRVSGGLVDATLIGEVERAGYTDSIDPDSPLRARGPGPLPEGEDPERRGTWSDVDVDRRTSEVIRPPVCAWTRAGSGRAWPPTWSRNACAGSPSGLSSARAISASAGPIACPAPSR